MELVPEIIAIAIAAWSAVIAFRALRHREAPTIQGKFVRATPAFLEDETSDPWRDPAVRFTNLGPYDYDEVIVELVGAADKDQQARSTPIYGLSNGPISLGSMRVGQFAIVKDFTSNPAGHGATVNFRVESRPNRRFGMRLKTWTTSVEISVPPVPPRPAIH